MSAQITSEFLDKFEELGLSRNEASVYLALLKNHPVTGYKLSKDSGILRPIVYEMLTRLVEKGGVKIVKSSPEQYSPIAPETFLMSLDKRFSDARSALVDSLSFVNKDRDSGDFWNISNKDSILTNIKTLALKAKTSILLYLNNESYAELLHDTLSKKAASGVKVIVFSYRALSLPGSDLYSYKIPFDISDPMIDNDQILLVVDNESSIIADIEAGKACQSMRPAQVKTTAEFIRMKIVLYRISHVLNPSKLSLYLFDEDKDFFKKFQP